MKPWLKAAFAYGGAILVTLLVLAWALRLSQANLAEPFQYSGDTLEWHLLFKNTLETGWYLSNPRLGAPFGLRYHDYPQPEALHYLGVKTLGLFTDNPFLIVNLVFLLGFPLVTASSLWVCRRLRLSWGPSLVVSLLYAFVPYHFHRSEDHLWLGITYAVPLLVLLILWVCSTEPLLFDAEAPGWKPRWRIDRRRALTAIIIVIIGGSTGAYYAFFAGALLCLGALTSSLLRRRWGSLWTALALALLLVTTCVANLAPNLLHWAREGRNPEVAARDCGESELYGMKLTQLVVPEVGHRLAPMRALAERYRGSTQLRNENNDPLGALGALGFLGLLAWLLVRRRDQDDALETRLAHLNLFALLIGTVGGLGALFAFTISPQIRAYNRISIFIAFFALLMAGLVLERAANWIARRRHGRWWAAAGLAAVCVLGLLDQIPTRRAPAYAHAAAERQSDREFFAAAEARHSPGAMVFQLPYRAFPESPHTYGSWDYDLARPFLSTRAMRWSYGAIRGRLGDRTIRNIAEEPLPKMLENVVLLGYEAVVLDRLGTPDQGAALEARLTDLVGPHEAVSRNQRFSMFDLRGFSAALRTRLGEETWNARVRQARSPLLWHWGQGCWSLESAHGSTWRWCDRDAELQVENHADHPRIVRLVFDVATGHPHPATLTFSGTLLSGQTPISTTPTHLERIITVPPGIHVIQVHTDARRLEAPPDPRRLFFRVENMRLGEVEAGTPQGP
jgi:phosphoglycerol transferase